MKTHEPLVNTHTKGAGEPASTHQPSCVDRTMKHLEELTAKAARLRERLSNQAERFADVFAFNEPAEPDDSQPQMPAEANLPARCHGLGKVLNDCDLLIEKLERI